MNDALGLVEIKGLAGAIAVADAMVKTANVGLIGIEKARGFGWITIKICGDVGAVTASVQTGRAVAEQNGQLVSYKVIARPAQAIGEVFCKVTQEPPPENPEPTPPLPSQSIPDPDSQAKAEVNVNSVVEEEQEAYLQQELVIQKDISQMEPEIQLSVDNRAIEVGIEAEPLQLNGNTQEEVEVLVAVENESVAQPEIKPPAKKEKSNKSPGRPSKNKKKREEPNLPHSEEGSR